MQRRRVRKPERERENRVVASRTADERHAGSGAGAVDAALRCLRSIADAVFNVAFIHTWRTGRRSCCVRRARVIVANRGFFRQSAASGVERERWARLMHSQPRRMAPHRLITALVATASLTTIIACSDKSSSSGKAPGKTCANTQALQSLGLRGSSMPAKSLALTFDDGPGPRTKQLSSYLKNEGIQATFFINGKSMGPDAGEILQQIVDDGHLVANHTETHRSLTGVATATARLTDPEIVQELSDTDTKITPYIPSQRFLFRPPFGDYDEQSFNALATSPMNKYIGPILWDVGDRMDEAAGRVADWDCWQAGSDGKKLPMKACGDLYVTEIKRASRGIVLMHDPYFNDEDPEQLGTVDLVMYIVPTLKAEGFTFMRVDQVPEIAALLPALPGGGADGGTTPNGGQPGQDVSPTEPGDDDPCK